MEQVARQDNKGFTLVEVMIAFVVIFIVMLGLLNLATQVIAVGVRNTVRDEGIRVAEEVMAQVRSLPYSEINTMTYGNLRKIIDPQSSEVNIIRNLRHFTIKYNPDIRVTTHADGKVIDVTVTWSYMQTDYSHTITSFVRER